MYSVCFMATLAEALKLNSNMYIMVKSILPLFVCSSASV